MSNQNQNKPGYKHTPLGWIPEGWEAVRIEDVARLNPSRTILPDEEEVSFLGMADVSEEGKIANGFIRKYGDVKNGFTYFKDGDILVAKITPCFENGKGALAKNLKNGIGFGSTEFHVIRSGEKVCPTYLFYHTRLYRFRGHGEQNMTGSAGQKRVPTDFIETYKIPLPPLSEQLKIAAILSTWDEAITKTQQLIAQLQQRNKGLMQQLLTGKKRLKGFENFKWKSIPLNILFERVQRKGEENINGIEILTISGRVGFLSQKEKFNRVIAGSSLKNYTLLKKGEFSYNKGNSTAYQYGCVFRLDQYNEALVPNVYISFKAISEIDTTFYAYYFKHDLLKPSLAKIISSGARMDGLLNVNAEDFFKIKVPLPSFEEQKEIGKILDNAAQELKLFEQKLAALQQQKKGLMQKLLTGEVRVKM